MKNKILLAVVLVASLTAQTTRVDWRQIKNAPAVTSLGVSGNGGQAATTTGSQPNGCANFVSGGAITSTGVACGAGGGTGGITGPTGPTGPAGQTGSTGPSGPSGPSGSNGVTGPTGAGVAGPTGPTGVVGPTGSTGGAGSTGATGNAGTSVNWRGTYAGGTTYTINDGVSFSGTSYVSLHGFNTGNQPDTHPADWQLIAQTGAQGNTGVTGPTGANGTTGTAGSTGTAGAVGATGATGTNGSNGSTGAVGSTGATGFGALASGVTGDLIKYTAPGTAGDTGVALGGTVGSGANVRLFASTFGIGNCVIMATSGNMDASGLIGPLAGTTNCLYSDGTLPSPGGQVAVFAPSSGIEIRGSGKTFQGTGTKIATNTGSFVATHLIAVDVNGNFVDSGTGTGNFGTLGDFYSVSTTSQTTFTPGWTLTGGLMLVFLDGQKQRPGVGFDYQISGNTIVFNTGLIAGRLVEVIQ